MKIVPPDEKGKYTGYYLHRDRKVHIPVFVLRYYLEQTLGLSSAPGRRPKPPETHEETARRQPIN